MELNNLARLTSVRIERPRPLPSVAQPTPGFRRALETRLAENRPEPKIADAPALGDHVVQRGDTLSQICGRALRDLGHPTDNATIHSAVQKVAAANGLGDPDLIHPGQKIALDTLIPRNVVQQATTPLSTPTVPTENIASATPKPSTPPQPEQETQAMQAAPARRNSADLTQLLEAILSDMPENAPAPASPWSALLSGRARLTSEYGMRRHPVTGRWKHHDGIDLAAKPGTRIYPLAPGTVTFSGWKSGYGRVVVVQHDNGTETVYGHTSANLVGVGHRVDTRQAIAKVGSTGVSTGPHLHFELRRNGRPVNPIPYIKRDPVRLASSL